MLDIGLYISYLLLAVSILGMIVFPIINGIKEPKALLRSLAGIGIILVLFGIAYALSNDDLSQRSAAMVTAGQAKLVSAGLILFYITLVGSVLAVVYSEVTKALK